MIQMRKLRQVEVSDFIDKLSFFYGCDLSELKQHSFFFNDKTLKMYLFSGDISDIELERVNSLGLYFGTMHDNDRFRLSIDGSQLIDAKRNFIILNEKSLKSYVSGESLLRNEIEKISWVDNCPFLIVKFADDNLGCANIKENEILSYVPKSRRLNGSRIF
jgi:NOL1/NOP2/fmu family ribosome biogenesis protein